MIKVMGSAVLVKVLPDENSDRTASGLYIARKEQQASQFAKIIAIGDGMRREKLAFTEDGEIKRHFEKVPLEDISIGDKVLINKYAGELVEIDDEEYLFIQYRDVLAVLEGE